jgi:hypothetical protein
MSRDVIGEVQERFRETWRRTSTASDAVPGAFSCLEARNPFIGIAMPCLYR